MVEIAQVSIGTRLDLSGFNTGIGNLGRTKAPVVPVQIQFDTTSLEKEQKRLQQLLQKNLTVKLNVDFSDLDALDRRTRAFSQRTSSVSVKVQADTSQLDSLEAQVNRLVQKTTSIKVDTSESSSSPSFATQATQSVRNADFDAKPISDEISKAVASSVKRQSSGGLFGSLFTGAFERLGASFTGRLGEGISKALEDSLTSKIGSFDLVGKAIFDKVIPGLFQGLGNIQILEGVRINEIVKKATANSGLEKKLQQSVEVLQSAIGKDQIEIEKRLLNSRRKESTQSRNQIAAKELGVEYKELLGRSALNKIELDSGQQKLEDLMVRKSRAQKDLQNYMSMSLDDKVVLAFNGQINSLESTVNRLKKQQNQLEEQALDLIAKEESGAKLSDEEITKKSAIESQYASIEKQLSATQQGLSQARAKRENVTNLSEIEKEALTGSGIKARMDKISEVEKQIAVLEKRLETASTEKSELERLLNVVGVEGAGRLEGRRVLRDVAIRDKREAVGKEREGFQDQLTKAQALLEASQGKTATYSEGLSAALADSDDLTVSAFKELLKKEAAKQDELQKIISSIESSIEKLNKAEANFIKRAEASVPEAEFAVIKESGSNLSIQEIGKDVAFNQLKNLSENYKDLLSKLKKLEFSSTEEIKDALDRMNQINQSIETYEKQADDALKVLSVSKKQNQGNTSLPQQSAGQSIKQPSQPIPAAYQDIIEEISSISGVSIAKDEIPKLKAFTQKQLNEFKKQGVEPTAGYVRERNTLYLKPEDLQALISDTVSADLSESLTHETVHGLQGEFGRLPESQISKKRELLRPTAEEYSKLPQLSEHIEGSTSLASKELEDLVRAQEQDAYIFAIRNKEQIAQAVQRKAAIRKAEQVGGSGGGKLSVIARDLEAQQTSELAKLIDGATYDVSGAQQKLEAKFANLRKVFQPYIDRLRSVDALPTEQIEGVTESVKILLEKVNASVTNYAAQIHEELMTEAQVNLKQQLQGGFTGKDELRAIAKSHGVGSSGTKEEIAGRIVDNVDINTLRKNIKPLAPQQQEIVEAASQLQAMGSETVSVMIRESVETSRTALKEFKTGAALENPLPDLEKDYQLVLELLSRNLEDDVRGYLEGAKLQIAKLRKEASVVTPPESESVEEEGIEGFQLAGQFTNPLEAAKARLQRAMESVQMGRSIGQSNKANADAAKAMAHVYEASLKQTDVEINKAISAFDEYEAETFKAAQAYIEQRLAEYGEAIQQAEVNANERVGLENAYVQHEGIQVSQQNARLMSEQELKGTVVNYSPLQTPEAVKQMAGAKPEGDTINLIGEALGDLFSGVAGRVRKQAEILQMHIPSLMTDIASSAVEAGRSGNTDEQKRLMEYHSQLSGHQSRIQELTQQTRLSPEDTKELQALNMATQDIFKSLNVAVPEVNGFFDAFTKGSGILGNTVGMLKGVVGGFLAFQGVMFLQNFLMNLAGSTTEAAIQMESLERRIGFVSGSSTEAAKNLGFIRGEVQRLGIDAKSAMEGFVGLAAATRDTGLENATQRIFSGVAQASTVYDLDQPTQERVFTAVQQMASKGKISAEELRGQLGESLPGAFQIAARAIGVTTQQLDKMMSTGQLLSEDFLPKFADQLAAETKNGVAGAANSSVSALLQFNNALFETEAAVGKAFLPLRNVSLGFFSAALKSVAVVLPTLIELLGALSGALVILGTISFAQAAAGIIQTIGGVGQLTAFLQFCIPAAGGLIAALWPLVAVTAAVYAGMKIWDQIKFAANDAGGSIRAFADGSMKGLQDYQKALDEAGGKTDEFKNKQKELSFGGKVKRGLDNFDAGIGSFFTGIGMTGVGRFFNPREVTERDDKLKAVDDAVKNGGGILKASASSQTTAAVVELNKLDKALEGLNTKRRAIVQLDPTNKAALRDIDAEQERLLEQRQIKSKPVALMGQQLQSQVDGYKATLKELDGMAEKRRNNELGGIDPKTYKERTDAVKTQLEQAQIAQEKFNKLVRVSVDAFQLMQQNIAKVADQLADANDKAAILANREKTQATLNSITNTVTPGQSQKQVADQTVEEIKGKLLRSTSAYNQTQALLDTDKSKAVLSAYGVTADTGQAELKTLADKAGAAQDEKAKYVLQQYSAQKKSEIDISQLQSELASAEKTAKDQLDQSNKAIADYYRSVDKQTADLAITAEESSVKIASQQMKNKVLDAMAGFQDNIFTQLADSIVSILDQLNKPIEEQLNATKQIQSNNFAYQDQLRQVNSLRRNSPDFQGNEQDLGLVLPNGTNLNQQKIPVQIDIQNLDSSKLDELNQKIVGVTKPAVDEVNTSTQSFQGSVTASGQAFDGTLNPAIDTAKSSSDILNASLGTQAGTIEGNAAQMTGFSMSTDASKNASDILASSLGGHAPLIQGNAATMTGFTGTTDGAKEASDKVQKSLAAHAPTINTANKAQSAHGATMQNNIGIAAKVTEVIKGWWGAIEGAIKRAVDLFKTFAMNLPLIGQVGQAMSGIGGNMAGAAQGILNSMGGSVAGNNPGGFKIFDSNRGGQINKFSDLTEHHNGRAGDGYRRGQMDGKEEEWAKDGSGRLVKDMVIKGAGGGADGTGTYLPAGATGTLHMTPAAQSGGYGNLVTIKLDVGGEVRMAHLQSFAPGLKDGQRITAGDIVGREGSTGRSSGTHLHFEADPKIVKAYVESVLSGNFDKLRGMFAGSAQAAVGEAVKNTVATPASPTTQSSGGTMSNMDRFLHVIAKGESNFDYGSTSSVGAAGYFQFIGGTRAAAIKRTGRDPVTPNIQQAAEVAAAWIQSEHPQAYAAIQAGDFQKAYYLLGQKRLEWTSLPGARETNWGKNSDFSMGVLQKYESGQFTPKFHINGASTAVKGVTGTYGPGGQAASVQQQAQAAVGTPAANMPVPQVWTPEGYGFSDALPLAGQKALNQAANQATANLAKQNQVAQSQANANADTSISQAIKQFNAEGEKLRQAQLQQMQQRVRNDRFARDEDLRNQIQTPEIQHQQSVNKINDQYDDKVIEQQELVRKLRDSVKAGETLQQLMPEFKGNKDALIAKLGDPEYQKQHPGMDVNKVIARAQQVDLGQLGKDINKSVEQSKNDLKSAEDLLGKLQAHRQKALDFEAQEKAHKDKLKQEEFKDSDIQNQAKLLETQIASVKQFQQTHPFDVSQGDPIEMQKTLDLLNQELAIRKAIRDLEEKKRNDPANSKAYDSQLAQLKEQDKQLRANIEMRTKLEADQRKADQAKAIQENKQFSTQLSNDLISARSQATDIYLKNHPFDYSMGDPLKDKYQTDVAAAQTEGEGKLIEFDDKTRLGKFIGMSAEEVAKLRQQIVDLNNLKLDNLKAEFNQTFKEREQQRLDFLLSQKQRVQSSDVALLQAQAGFYSSRGMGFKGQEFEKQAAIVQQQMSYDSALRELDKLQATGQESAETVAHLKENLNSLNDIKLQGINDQFNKMKPVIDSVGGALKTGLVGLFKEGKFNVKQFFDTIFSSVAELASNFIVEKLMSMFNPKSEGKGGFFAAQQPKKQGGTDFLSAVGSPLGGFGGGTPGATPMQPAFVSVVGGGMGGSPLGGGNPLSFASESLFGGQQGKGTGFNFVDSLMGDVFGNFSANNPLPVGLESAKPNLFESLFSNGFSGVAQGIGNIFGGGGGGGGGFGIGNLFSIIPSLFGLADGGRPTQGFITRIPNYADGKLASGIHEAMQREHAQSGGRKPVLAVLNTDEMVLNAQQTKRFEAIGGTDILNFASGGIVGADVGSGGEYGGGVSAGSSPQLSVNMNVESHVINNVEYARMDDVRVAAQQAAQQGAEMGAKAVSNKMRHSPSFRNNHRLG